MTTTGEDDYVAASTYRRRRLVALAIALALTAAIAVAVVVVAADDDDPARRAAPTASPTALTAPSESASPTPAESSSPEVSPSPSPSAPASASASAAPSPTPSAAASRTSSPSPSSTRRAFPPKGLVLDVSGEPISGDPPQVRFTIRVRDNDGSDVNGTINFGDGTSLAYSQRPPAACRQSPSEPAPGYRAQPIDKSFTVSHAYDRGGRFTVTVTAQTERPCDGTPAETARRTLIVEVPNRPRPSPTPTIVSPPTPSPTPSPSATPTRT